MTDFGHGVGLQHNRYWCGYLENVGYWYRTSPGLRMFNAYLYILYRPCSNCCGGGGDVEVTNARLWPRYAHVANPSSVL